MNYFGTVRQQFRRKIVTLPSALLFKPFRYTKINETLKDAPPTEFFGTVRQKKFR